MSAFEHDQATTVSQQLNAVAVVHNSRVCPRFGVDGRGYLHGHHYASIVVVVVAEGLCKER